ncbi:thiosulfate oxidation carrier protein SoxY [Rhodospirillum sp. A1_3_36]|uniref:thiosulfate oxidation carrier protein SoxY n=1 Tax=Rhodospirillum sp. A1_3_36 TaxID=3391666 RepID=UPI0039A5A761
MRVTRRQVLAFGAATAAVTLVGIPVSQVLAAAPEMEAKIKEFTGGATPGEGKLTLTAPEIAENGNTVPISVSVDSPMTAEDHVAAVMVLAEGNPSPGVVTFHFTPLSGKAEASTRIRLAKTQNVVAVARMSDGSVTMAASEVKVTIGGCGG